MDQLSHALCTIADAARSRSHRQAQLLLDFLGHQGPVSTRLLEPLLIDYGFELGDLSPSDRVAVWTRGRLQLFVFERFDESGLADLQLNQSPLVVHEVSPDGLATPLS